MTRPFGMPETPKGRKGWKQNSNGKPNNWALNWSPSNSRLHNDPIQRGGVPWKPQAITLKTPSPGVNEFYKKGCEEKSSLSTGGREDFVSRSSPLHYCKSASRFAREVLLLSCLPFL